MLNISTQFCLGTTDLTPRVLNGVSYSVDDMVDVYDLGRDVLGVMASVEEECGRQRRVRRIGLRQGFIDASEAIVCRRLDK